MLFCHFVNDIVGLFYSNSPIFIGNNVHLFAPHCEGPPLIAPYNSVVSRFSIQRTHATAIYKHRLHILKTLFTVV